MRRFLIYSSFLFLLFSCNKEGEKTGHVSIGWSPGIEKLLHDTLKDKPFLDSLRREVLKASNDTDAINRANLFAEKLPAEQLLQLTEETGLQSKKLDYKYGMLISIYYKGVYHYKQSDYDSALVYYDEVRKQAKQDKFLRLQAKCLAKTGEVYYMEDNYGKSYDNFQQALIISTINKDQNTEAFCLSHIGELYRMQNDYEKALDFYGKAIDLSTKIGNKDVISYSIGSMGDIYRAKGNFSKALDYYQQELAYAKRTGDKYEIAFALSSIADANRLNSSYEAAINYYNQSLDLFHEIDDKTNIAYCLSNIADSYQRLNDSKNAISYAKQAMAYSTQVKDNLSIDDCLNTIGDIYEHTHNYDSAFFYLNKGLENATKINDRGGMAFCTRMIARIYFENNKTPEALQEAEKSMELSKQSHVGSNIKGCSELMYQIYEKAGDYKNAFLMHKLYTTMKDSLLSSDQVKKFAAVELKSRENELKADQAKKDADYKAEKIKKDEELKRQKTIAYAVTSGLVLVLLLAFVIFRSLQQNKKAKKTIEHQKELVEEKQKEIVDSITYAKRLQQAILPPVAQIKKYFPESFLLYKPKDIVAGDFYWMEKIGETIFIAAADCTGHGVPGAMVSVVCSNALNRTVKEFKISDTGKILDKVRELVIETFEKSESEVKDGMDISLISITGASTADRRLISWSGANNPLWYLHEGKLTEIKADKQPIGQQENSKPFTTHIIDPAKGDSFFLFTDGYADQFGGPKGKKFRYKQLEELLAGISSLPMEEQKSALEKAFDEWKGNLDQVDDVCMIGIRV